MMTDEEEEAYVEGSHAAWRSILGLAVKNLDLPLPADGGYLMMLADIRSQLRSLCRDFDLPNDWSDDVHLADVIDKYIRPGLWDRDMEDVGEVPVAELDRPAERADPTEEEIADALGAPPGFRVTPMSAAELIQQGLADPVKRQKLSQILLEHIHGKPPRIITAEIPVTEGLVAEAPPMLIQSAMIPYEDFTGPPAVMENLPLMDLAEFRDHGLLHEINRQILNPLGLAMALVIDPLWGSTRFAGIIDWRKSPEGFYLERVHLGRVKAYQELLAARSPARLEKLGYIVQPLPATEEPEREVKVEIDVVQRVLAAAEQEITEREAEFGRCDDCGALLDGGLHLCDKEP